MTNSNKEYPVLLKMLHFFSVMIVFDHRCGYFKPSKSFQFKENNKSMIWHYKLYFNYESKNVIYILMCNTFELSDLGQISNLK